MDSSHRSPVDRIAHATLLTALLTVLAFQELRFEGYETEKAGLLMGLGAVLLGCHLLRFDRVAIRAHLTHPLVIGVIALLAWSTLSTAFSLSPSRSFFGTPDRPDGLLMRWIYALIFIQAIISAPRLLHDLLPTLTMLAVAMCGFGLLLNINGTYTERIASTTGNPNYLSAWLVMALVAGMTLTALQIRGWKRPWTTPQQAYLALLGVVAVVMLLTLAMAASRGALLGLSAGGLVSVVAAVTLMGRRRALIAMVGVVIIAVAGYALISVAVQNSDNPSSRLTRIFQPYDPFRINAWEGAANIITSATDPITDYKGDRDAFAALRPFIGFGLETTVQTQGAFGVLSSDRLYINSFHNQGFDALVTTGLGGLLAWVLIYGGAVYTLLRRLGLLPDGQVWPWFAMQVVGGNIGVVVAVLLIPEGSVNSLAPFGFVLGTVGALVLWIASRIQTTPELPMLEPVNILQIGLLGIIIVRLVDHQFGFPQAASEPLWWALLGLCAAYTRAEIQAIDAVTIQPATWVIATAAAILMMLYSLGYTWISDSIAQSVGLDELPGVLIALVSVGLLAAWLSGAGLPVRLIVIGGAVCIGYAALKWILVTITGDAIDAANTQSAPDLSGMMLLLSLQGITVLIIICGLWLRPDQPMWANWQPLTAGVIVITLVFGIAATATYYSGSMLHAHANRLSRVGTAEWIARADTIYADGATLTPYNARLRLDMAFNLLKTVRIAQSDDLSAVDAELDTLFAYEPYYHHSLAWQLFAAQYDPLTNAP